MAAPTYGSLFVVTILIVHLYISSCEIWRHDDSTEENVIHFSGNEELSRKINTLTLESGQYSHPLRVRRSAMSKSECTTTAGEPKICINILPDESHNQAIIAWTDSNVILLLTRQRSNNGTVVSSTMWRSGDMGNTFQLLKGFPIPTIISRFYVIPANKTKVLFIDRQHGRMFTSDDRGHTPQSVSMNFSPDRIRFHPTNGSLILAYDYMEKKLFVSVNGGRNWNPLQDHANQRFYWFVPGMDSDPNTVHMEIEDISNVDQFHYKKCILGDRVQDLTLYPCKRQVIPEDLPAIEGLTLLLQNQYIFVQSYQTRDLYVSYNRGPFLRAYFPNDVTKSDFSVISTDERQVFIAAYHKLQVDLYLSDITGRYYIESIQNVLSLPVRSGPLGKIDFHEVKGLPGIFIANQLKKKKVPTATLR